MFEWLFRDKTAELFQAIGDSNAAQVKELLAARVDLASRSTTIFQGYTPLHAASYCCLNEQKLAILKMLVANPRRLDLEDKCDRGTALHIAAMSGGYHAVKCLLDAGANKECLTTDTGRTPLHCAVYVFDSFVVDGRARTWQAHLGAILALIEAGANVRARTNRGSTPLDMALTKLFEQMSQDEDHYLDMIVMLLDAGADGNLFLNKTNDEGAMNMSRDLMRHGKQRSRDGNRKWSLVVDLLRTFGHY